MVWYKLGVAFNAGSARVCGELSVNGVTDSLGADLARGQKAEVCVLELLGPRLEHYTARVMDYVEQAEVLLVPLLREKLFLFDLCNPLQIRNGRLIIILYIRLICNLFFGFFDLGSLFQVVYTLFALADESEHLLGVWLEFGKGFFEPFLYFILFKDLNDISCFLLFVS